MAMGVRIGSISLVWLTFLLALANVATIEARKSPAAFSPAVTTTVSQYQQRPPVADYTHGSTADLLLKIPPNLLPRGGETSAFVADLLGRLKIASYFALWYALNVVYNIINKNVLNVLPAPLTVGSLQFGIGALYASTLWVLHLRTRPTLTPRGKKAIFHIGLHHALGQLLSMVSLGAGPVSFTHIVKALEPFFSAIVSVLLGERWMKPQVYATLLFVVGGVGYACLKERSFSWLAFYTAMGSNVAFALRAVLSKAAMSSSSSGDDSSLLVASHHLTSANLFGLVTWAAFLISIPIALLFEGNSFPSQWKDAVVSSVGGGQVELIRSVVLSGLFHYLNNEVMYLALSNVHPVTLAVGNTMKRVFILVASVMVFRNPVSLQAGIGSAVGISGVLLYSLTKQHYEELEKRVKEKEAHRGRRGAKRVPAKSVPFKATSRKKK